MANGSHISPSQEYESLRGELAQSRKYMFERPLAIVALGLILIAGGHAGSAVWAALLAGVLLFNFWFTANRLGSAAQIIAYIQVVLEGEALWEGWESSLRKYRMWVKGTPDLEKIVRAELTESDAAVPDALMAYRPIYLLHIALVVVTSVAGVVIAVTSPNVLNVLAACALAPIVVAFAWHCFKWNPCYMRTLIEREGIIWTHALKLKATGRWRRQSGRFAEKLSNQAVEKGRSPGVVVSVVAAALSVLMALSVFSYTNRGARITSDLAGEMVYGKLSDGTFYIVAPLAYRNAGGRSGALTGFYLDITEYDVETDTEGRTYRLCPDTFQELSADGDWVPKSNAIAIPVEAGRSGVEFVRFTGQTGQGPELSHTFAAGLHYATAGRDVFKQAQEQYVILNNVSEKEETGGQGAKYEVLSSMPSVRPDLSRSKERGYL